jgi:hypothetical protein
MNIYTQRFRATCPNNGRSVDYMLTVESPRMIMVEDIQAAVSELKGYHEDFADVLWERFGGRQTLTAHHHGTDVETVRP